MIIPIVLFGLMFSSIVAFIDINDKEEIWFKKKQRKVIYTLCFLIAFIIVLGIEIFT